MTTTSTFETWLSPAQAARALGVSPQTVHNLFDAGRLRGVRTSIGRLVEPESVAEMAAKRRRAT